MRNVPSGRRQATRPVRRGCLSLLQSSESILALHLACDVEDVVLTFLHPVDILLPGKVVFHNIQEVWEDTTMVVGYWFRESQPSIQPIDPVSPEQSAVFLAYYQQYVPQQTAR